jgi:hypothetical protein
MDYRQRRIGCPVGQRQIGCPVWPTTNWLSGWPINKLFVRFGRLPNWLTMVLFANGDIHHSLGQRPRNYKQRRILLANGHIQMTDTVTIAAISKTPGR